MKRNFTYIDDFIEVVVRILDKTVSTDTEWNGDDPNSAISQVEDLMCFIQVLEESLGKKAKIEMLPMQNGDVTTTFADTSALEKAVDFKPSTSIEAGLKRFADWYQRYYSLEI